MTQPDPSTAVNARDWLSGEHEAQLAYATGHGWRHLVVRYAMLNGRLVFRLPEYSSAVGYARNQPVTIEVPVHDRRGASSGHVRVSGTASVVSDDDRAGADHVLDEHWPDGVVTHVLALPTTEVDLVEAVPAID
jgi:hypothetical protein